MTSSDIWKPDMVIYHDKCFDGMGAAWACHRRFGNCSIYRADDYGQNPPDVTDMNVLIVDFSYKKAVLEEMAKDAKSILILDHHQTSWKDLEDYALNPKDPQFGDYKPVTDCFRFMDTVIENQDTRNIFAVFGFNSQSGAGLAWEFCFPGQDAPLLVKWIEDRDLWKFTYLDSKAFSVWLGTRPQSFAEYDKINKDLSDNVMRSRIVYESHVMKLLFDNTVISFASHAEFRDIGGYLVPTVCCPLEFRSEVGNYLVTQYREAPFAAVFYDSLKQRKWSLRSREGTFNVAEVAEKFGGGGHPSSASFFEENS